MNELLVIEKITAGGCCEIVKKGYSPKLLNKYLAQKMYTTPNAVFVLRAARSTDALGDVSMVYGMLRLSEV
jgi:hypothetical protein